MPPDAPTFSPGSGSGGSGVCVVVGAGPGTGAAIGARFAKAGYAVALCARDHTRVQALAAGISGARAYALDVQDIAAPQRVLGAIRQDLGPVRVLAYNAGAGSFANFEDATVDQLQHDWEVNARGLFTCAKAALADLRDTGGSIVVTGATAALRGGAGFAPFAQSKAAQRVLAQSMARHLGPQGIHVSYVVVDGVIDLPRTRARMPDKADDFFLAPDQIAESVYFLAHQPRQAWTFELDLRPFGERW